MMISSCLRSVFPEDTVRILEWFHDIELRHRLNLPMGNLSKDELFYWLGLNSPLTDTKIIVTETGEAIGILTTSRSMADSVVAKFHLSIGNKGYWRKGYGTRAVRQHFMKLFLRTSVQHIHGRIARHNVAALHWCDSLGFRRGSFPNTQASLGSMEIEVSLEKAEFHPLPA